MTNIRRLKRVQKWVNVAKKQCVNKCMWETATKEFCLNGMWFLENIENYKNLVHQCLYCENNSCNL